MLSSFSYRQLIVPQQARPECNSDTTQYFQLPAFSAEVSQTDEGASAAASA